MDAARAKREHMHAEYRFRIPGNDRGGDDG